METSQRFSRKGVLCTVEPARAQEDQAGGSSRFSKLNTLAIFVANPVRTDPDTAQVLHWICKVHLSALTEADRSNSY